MIGYIVAANRRILFYFSSDPSGITAFVPTVAPKLVPAFAPIYEPFHPLPFRALLSSDSFDSMVSITFVTLVLDLGIRCAVLDGWAATTPSREIKREVLRIIRVMIFGNFIWLALINLVSI